MLKVLVVDDDAFVHTQLKKIINWEKEGFLLHNEAVTGTEAAAVIKKVIPDIIITDMSMPGMDGVEVIEHVNRNHPHIKVIALSGYDDFDYVKKSLKMGAVDYILKHELTSELLLALLQSLKEEILSEGRETAGRQKTEEQIKTGKDFLRQSFINVLVREGISDRGEAERKIKNLGLEIETRNLVVAAGEIDDYLLLKEEFSSGELHNLLNSFVLMATQILKETGKAVISFLEAGNFVIIFSFDDLRSGHFIYNQVLTAVTRIKSTIKRYLNITACFSIGEICRDIVKINRYYENAAGLLKKRFYEGKDKIFRSASADKVKEYYYKLEIKDEKNILKYLKFLKEDQFKNCLESIFAKLQREQPSINRAKMTFVALINIIHKVAGDAGIDLSMIYAQGEDPYGQLEKFGTIQEIKDWLFLLYGRLLRLLRAVYINPVYDEVTGKAVEYICKNYKHSISLSDVAGYIGVNSSYLSRKFKKDCGKGFNEYLNKIRIEYAKILMENGYENIKEIVTEVGFNNYNYFFKVFKDSQGMTPLEYRMSCRV